MYRKLNLEMCLILTLKKSSLYIYIYIYKSYVNEITMFYLITHFCRLFILFIIFIVKNQNF